MTSVAAEDGRRLIVVKLLIRHEEELVVRVLLTSHIAHATDAATRTALGSLTGSYSEAGLLGQNQAFI